jgi:hypothetical protein
MIIIVKHIKWIMLVPGLLACSMIFAVFTPQTSLINIFGESLTEPLALIVVRSWGFLLFLLGSLLIYGAFKPTYRNLALVISILNKVVFIAILVFFGDHYLHKTMVTIILDSIFVIIFIAYLFKAKRLD